MGASVGAGDGDKLNVELNVVPFIDLMSCLTAFLLVTAVWTQYSQINIKPKGLSRDATKKQDDEPPVNASVLVTKNEIWVGLTTGERTQIRKEGDHDWSALKEKLAEIKELAVFENRADIEIAAEDEIAYQTIIWAMDTAVSANFRDIGYVDPSSLSVRFKE